MKFSLLVALFCCSFLETSLGKYLTWDQNKVVINKINECRQRLIQGDVYNQPQADPTSLLNITGYSQAMEKLATNAIKDNCGVNVTHAESSANGAIFARLKVTDGVAVEKLLEQAVELMFTESKNFVFDINWCKYETYCDNYRQIAYKRSRLIGCNYALNDQTCEAPFVLICYIDRAVNKEPKDTLIYQVDTRPPVPMTQQQVRDVLLKEHNRIRQQVNDGEMLFQPQAKKLPMLTWDSTLEQEAEKLVKTCLPGMVYDKKMFNVEARGWKYCYKTTQKNELQKIMEMWTKPSQVYKFYNHEGVYMPDAYLTYLNLVQERNTRVGCATYMAKKDSNNTMESPWMGNLQCPAYNMIVVCKYNYGATLEDSPYDPMPLDGNISRDEIRRIILDAHNTYRQMVQNGLLTGQPKAKAGQLPNITYDLDLEKKAQLTVDRCGLQDLNNTTPIKLAQNVHTALWKVCIQTTMETELRKAVDIWFSNYRSYDYGLTSRPTPYTQIVSAKNHKVGCSYLLDQFNKKCDFANWVVVCNYEDGSNAPGQLPYEQA